MKSYGSRFCRECGNLFRLGEPDDEICASCEQSPAPAQRVVTPMTAVAVLAAPIPPAPPPPAKPRRDARKRAPRPRRAARGRNSGPVTGPRTLPMLRALAENPAGLTTPQLAELASSATSWVNALGATRQLMLKQQRRGRVLQAGTVPGDRTRGSALWRLTEAGSRYVLEQREDSAA